MILIADSGSTKTDWRLIDREGNIHQTQTIGLNPYFVTDDQVIEALTAGPIKLVSPDEVIELHFYGSGIGNLEQRDRINNLLRRIYHMATICVEHDLLGAARALCADRAGIAVILGTGANSCVYNGEEITRNIPSLGYILGDEGSGAHLGKRWIQACLQGQAPQELREEFFRNYGVDRDHVLSRVYSGDRPNRFLASFVPFIYEHREQSFMKQLIEKAFYEHFELYLTKYPEHHDLPIHFCGSVAFYFQRYLRSIAENRGMLVGNVVQAPIAALTLYHLDCS